MIDGNAQPRGFNVLVHADGYKDWTARYSGNADVFEDEDGHLIRLDSIELILSDSPEPSFRLSGGPEAIKPFIYRDWPTAMFDD